MFTLTRLYKTLAAASKPKWQREKETNETKMVASVDSTHNLIRECFIGIKKDAVKRKNEFSVYTEKTTKIQFKWL